VLATSLAADPTVPGRLAAQLPGFLVDWTPRCLAALLPGGPESAEPCRPNGFCVEIVAERSTKLFSHEPQHIGKRGVSLGEKRYTGPNPFFWFQSVCGVDLGEAGELWYGPDGLAPCDWPISHWTRWPIEGAAGAVARLESVNPPAGLSIAVATSAVLIAMCLRAIFGGKPEAEQPGDCEPAANGEATWPVFEGATDGSPRAKVRMEPVAQLTSQLLPQPPVVVLPTSTEPVASPPRVVEPQAMSPTWTEMTSVVVPASPASAVVAGYAQGNTVVRSSSLTLASPQAANTAPSGSVTFSYPCDPAGAPTPATPQVTTVAAADYARTLSPQFPNTAVRTSSLTLSAPSPAYSVPAASNVSPASASFAAVRNASPTRPFQTYASPSVAQIAQVFTPSSQYPTTPAGGFGAMQMPQGWTSPQMTTLPQAQGTVIRTSTGGRLSASTGVIQAQSGSVQFPQTVAQD